MTTMSRFAIILALSLSTSAFAQTQVSALRVQSVAGVSPANAASVQIDLGGEAKHTLFRLNNPTRIVIDLQNADASSVEVPELANDNFIRSVTKTHFNGREGKVARLVFVLAGDVEFNTRSEANVLHVTMNRKGASADEPLRVSQPQAATPADVTDVIELTGEGSTQSASQLVSVAAQKTGAGIVKLKTNGAIERYEIEEMNDPSRLVIDLYGVKTKRDYRKSMALNAVERVRVANHGDKTRVVLDGIGAAFPAYDVALSDEGLSVVFSSEARNKAAAKAKAISFEPHDGFYRLKVDVEGDVRARTVADGPNRKAIKLEGVRNADAILGAHAFSGGPVQSANVRRSDAGDIIVELNVSDDIEHKVWKKADTLHWDVRKSTAQASGRAQAQAAPYAITLGNAAHEGATARRYNGRRITLDVMDADIVNVLRLFGDISRRNIVVAENVQGKVTIKLKNVPWDQALNVILRTKQLGKETRGGIIRIALQSDLDAERKARLELAESQVKQAPTSVKLIPVNYAVARELKTQVEQLLSERGKAAFDERTNVIIVEDINENLDQAEKLVRTLDTQTPQVMIEARMVEASTTFTRSLGIQWGGGLLFSERGGNPTGLVFPANVGLVGGADTQQSLQGGQATPGVTFPPNFAVNLPSPDAPTSGVGLNLGSIGNFGFLNARITAAETNGQAKTITAPKITTLNNKQAVINQCVDIPITVSTNNTINTTVIQACIQLQVRPHVTADGSVLMEIDLSNDSPVLDQALSAQPVFNRKRAQTEMLVRDGDTAVIGGIYTRQFGETYQETPFLSKIPLIGWLFKNVRSVDQRGELLVFLTPRIINRAVSVVSGQ